MMNLVKNATEHTRESDLIEIGSQIRANYLYLWVRDTGEGIIESEQERIFQRFARVENHQRRSDGFGLGLSIVKGIAEAHRGRVEVISHLGIGSTFTLIIPTKGV
jgi:signal transduction histidine kinase